MLSPQWRSADPNAMLALRRRKKMSVQAQLNKHWHYKNSPDLSFGMPTYIPKLCVLL